MLDFRGAVAERCLWQKAGGGIFIVGGAQKSITVANHKTVMCVHMQVRETRSASRSCRHPRRTLTPCARREPEVVVSQNRATPI